MIFVAKCEQISVNIDLETVLARHKPGFCLEKNRDENE